MPTIDEAVTGYIAAIKAMDIGPTLGFGPEMGSLVSESQLETVTDHVNDAVKKGASVLAGGTPRPDLGPYFYEPTLLDAVTEDMTLCREETFGPVVSTYRFSTVDDAVQRANDSRYGLNASIWTSHGRKGRDIAARAMVEALVHNHDGPLNVVGPGATSPWQAVRLGGRFPMPVVGPGWAAKPEGTTKGDGAGAAAGSTDGDPPTHAPGSGFRK